MQNHQLLEFYVIFKRVFFLLKSFFSRTRHNQCFRLGFEFTIADWKAIGIDKSQEKWQQWRDHWFYLMPVQEEMLVKNFVWCWFQLVKIWRYLELNLNITICYIYLLNLMRIRFSVCMSQYVWYVFKLYVKFCLNASLIACVHRKVHCLFKN